MSPVYPQRENCSLFPARHLSRSIILFLGFFLLLFLVAQAQAAQVTLAWDPNTETDLAGYKLYYGTSSGNYSNTLAVGNVTTYTVLNLTEGVTYYFVLTALDQEGFESGYSNEISYASAPPATRYTLTASAGPNGSISPAGTVTVNQGESRTFSVTPGTGFRVADVLVDGTSVGAVAAYTFSAVTGNHTISASFAANTYTLMVAQAGNGSGTVTSSPAGTSFIAGAVVSLTAAPAANSVFTGWSGACSGTVNPCSVIMNGNKAVTATFNPETVKPSSTITSPSNGANLRQLSFTITGNASDDNGSGVQKVEVSTDGGSTWKQAAGTSAWTHTWDIPGNGTYQIKSRATDLEGNVETPTAGISVQVATYHPTPVTVTGKQLLVNGSPFTVKGVVYSPIPIGEDPNLAAPYGDYFTESYRALHERDLPLLRTLGANTVRLYHWEKTADHAGFLDRAFNGGADPVYVIAGYWIDAGLDLNPASPANVREQLKADFREMVAAHKNHPAILMWSVGHNLNQAGSSADQLSQVFSLINEMAETAQLEEGASAHPVTTALADQDLAATISGFEKVVPALDVWGANVHRGRSFGALFGDLGPVTGKPLLIMEYGIDAFDQSRGDEYEKFGTPVQADYAEALWKEIAANGQACVGGTILSYSDEWWKARYSDDPGCLPDPDPDAQGRCGFPTDGQPDGYANEEWWGLVRIRDNGTAADTVEPRAAYYRLQNLWKANALTVVSPNGGESLVNGRSQTIRWSYAGQPGANVKIQLLKNGSIVQTISKSAAIGASGQGSFAWTPSYRLKPGSDYRIRITSTTNSAYTDYSDGNFSLQYIK